MEIPHDHGSGNGAIRYSKHTDFVFSNERVILEGVNGKSSLKFDGRYKLCFDYLDINNVDISGEAVINAGLVKYVDQFNKLGER